MTLPKVIYFRQKKSGICHIGEAGTDTSQSVKILYLRWEIKTLAGNSPACFSHHMTTEEKQQFHEKLLKIRARIGDEIQTLEDKTKPISPENSLGRISRMDAINNKGVAEYSLRQAHRRLNAVNNWLGKIDSNSDALGKCVSCKNEIPFKRLMFMPHSLKCMRCSSR